MQASALLFAPKLVQTGLAVLGDLYTWKLAEKVYGQGSKSAWSAVSCEPSARNSCPIPLISRTVVHHGAKSLAMVLRNQNFFKYSGNDFDHHGVELLAMGAAWRCI